MNTLPPDDRDPSLDRLLAQLPARFDPRPGFQTTLEARLHAQLPSATGPRWRRLPGLPLPSRLVAAPLLFLALLAGILLASPPARAQVLRFACFVPGLGIQTCDARGLVATEVRTVAHAGATVTVTQLLSTAAGTTVRLQVSGGADLSKALGKATVALRDDHGRAYAPTARFSSAPAAPGGGPAYQLEIPFPALASDARTVAVTLAGPAPLGAVTVPVPVAPLPLAGLAMARPGGATATQRGVTVRVAAVVADARGTEVQLVARAPASLGAIVGLAGWGRNPGGVDRPLRPITLTDDHGRVYQEVPSPPSPPPAATAQAGGFTDDVAFPPLPPDVRSARLTLPYVVLSEDQGAVTVRVPVGHAGFNVPLPVQADRTLGPDPIRVTGASIDPNGCDLPRPPTPTCYPLLMLRLDLGGWHDGRKVVVLWPTLVDGQPASLTMGRPGPTDDVQQWVEAGAPLPAGHGDQVELTLRGELVALAGPWQLSVPVGAPTPTAGR